MKISYCYLLLVCALAVLSCGDSEVREGEIDPAETIEQSADYEDIDSDGDGEISYEEQSARGPSTTNTTNYTDQADSLRAKGDTLVKPTYTDDEYEPAFSTSTTNPANQVGGRCEARFQGVMLRPQAVQKKSGRN